MFSSGITRLCEKWSIGSKVEIGGGSTATSLYRYTDPHQEILIFLLKKLEEILNLLFLNPVYLVICGDFNVNFMTDNTKKYQIMLLLQTYNLDYVLTFPTWISTVSATTIDNIILDRSKNDNMIVEPYYNGLSDHDAQLLTLRTPACKITELATPRHVRSYEAAAVIAFKVSLSFENWEGVFNCLNDDDVNITFNNFLNVYLRISYSSFPLHRTMSRDRCKG